MNSLSDLSKPLRTFWESSSCFFSALAIFAFTSCRLLCSCFNTSRFGVALLCSLSMPCSTSRCWLCKPCKALASFLPIALICSCRAAFRFSSSRVLTRLAFWPSVSSSSTTSASASVFSTFVSDLLCLSFRDATALLFSSSCELSALAPAKSPSSRSLSYCCSKSLIAFCSLPSAFFCFFFKACFFLFLSCARFSSIAALTSTF
mmetsp:Transcript_45285/g.88993  ORF Transcript_45285/g.88993 Transcript_45285/m.88993 type:complete len:204 (-) Transcript_45285:1732-2343(-)